MAMASKVKPWREAATLILTAHLGRTTIPAAQLAKSPTSKGISQHPGVADLSTNLALDKSYIKEKMTRDNTVIYNGTRGNNTTNDAEFRKKIIPMSSDYSTLLLTRNVHRNTFFAGSHVFPGGALDKADFSSKWMELFHQAGFQYPSDFGQLVSAQRDKTPILRTSCEGSPIPPDVAFRICAIRETFEESGVLLLRSIKDCHAYVDYAKPFEDSVPFGSVFTQLTDTEVKMWRDAVHSDGSKFIELCKNFEALPDIWSLAEWSNWLTPSDNKKRFDTMFYICSLQSIPDTKHDEKESIQSEWMIPIDALTKYCNEELYLPPPQIYELQRMCTFGEQGALHKFLSHRAFLGIERLLPVRLNSADGLISLLPGDDLYPKEPVLHHLRPDEILSTEQTIEESARPCKHLHRFEFRTVTDYDLVCNFELPHGHIGPKHIFEDNMAASKL